MLIDDFFPEKGKLVLNANGKEFIERLGMEAVRQVVTNVLMGENIRTQTEPLTRRRITIATGAILYFFARGWSESENFTETLSEKALEQMLAPHSTKTTLWPAMWLIGLTGKSNQNVLRNNVIARNKYVIDFENAIEEAAQRCQEDFGPISMNLGYVIDGQSKNNLRQLNWKDISHLSTAIGTATLTLRGSEKSTYGKLFERLVMGSVLTLLGFKYVPNSLSDTLEKVFWLSDSSDLRECDATIRLRPGKLLRFDIGFIGRGNPEIMKDKLSRFSLEVEQNGVANYSHTYIIVDKMPDTTKTLLSALRSGTEIIQMSMQYWPLDLAQKLYSREGYESEILSIQKEEIGNYIEKRVGTINILDYISSSSISEKKKYIRDERQLYLLNSMDEEEIDEDDDI